MSIAFKQLLVIVITFVFLLLQLGLKRASMEPRDLSSSEEVIGSLRVAHDELAELRAQKTKPIHTNNIRPPKTTLTFKKHPPETFSKSTKGDGTDHDGFNQPISTNDSETKWRMESTLAEYIKVCDSIQSHRMSPELKYGSYAFGRLRWCSVPKSGTTFLVRDLRPTLRKIGETKEETPKLFIVVREPYSRLVSAYFSKIVGHPSWWFSFGRKIIHEFRTNPSSNSTRCGHDVTFQEFIKFVIYSVNTSFFHNDHFMPIYKVCDMCHDPPDFIVKLETITSDMKFVLNSVNVSGNTGKKFIEVQHLAKLFMSFKHKFQDCAPMCSLLNRFWWGQQATGLISNHIPLPVKGQACDQMTGDSLAQLAWDAHLESVQHIGDKQRHKRKTSKELWSQVSNADKNKVRDILTLDCRLFGYDCSPEFVFAK